MLLRPLVTGLFLAVPVLSQIQGNSAQNGLRLPQGTHTRPHSNSVNTTRTDTLAARPPAVDVAPLLPVAAQEPEEKGLMAARQEEFPLAVRYFEEARKHAPYSAEVLFNLGLAEAKLPGREMRAIVWLEAYLAANPAATNGSLVKKQIEALEIKAEGNLVRLSDAAQQALSHFPGDPKDWSKQRAIGKVAVACAQAGDFSGARQLANESEPSSLDQIVTAELELGQIEAALDVASLISSKETIYRPAAYEQIAVAMAQAGDIGKAQSALENSMGGAYKHRGLIAIAKAMYKAGQKREAYATLEQAGQIVASAHEAYFSSRDKESALHDVATAQSQLEDIQGALRTMALMDTPNERGALYQQLAGDALARGDFENATRFTLMSPDGWGNPKRAIEETVEKSFNQQLTNALIKLVTGDVVAAHSLLSKIPNSQAQCSVTDPAWFKPYTSPNAALISKLSVVNWAEAESRVSQIPCAGDRISSLLAISSHVWDPGARSGRIAAAREATRAMTDSSDKLSAVYALVRADLETDQLSAALTDAGLVPKPSDATWALIAMYQAQHRDIAGARTTSRKISDRGRDLVLDEIVSQLRFSGDYAGAIEIASEMTTGYRDRSSWYRQVINTKTEADLLHQAVLDPSLINASFINKAADRDSFAGALARELAKHAMFDRGRSVADSIAATPAKVSAYIGMATLARQFGNVAMSRDLLADAQKIANSAASPQDQAEGLRRIAEYFIDLQDVRTARPLLAEAIRITRSISTPAKLASLLEIWNSIMAASQRAGLFAESHQSAIIAADAARSLDSTDYRRTYDGNRIADAEAAQGNLIGALRDIAEFDHRDNVLKSFALRQVGYGNLEGALQTALRASGTAKADIYRSIVERQVSLNDLAAAEQTFALHLPGSEAAIALATQFAKTGQFDKATRYFAYASPQLPYLSGLAELCSELAKNGELNLAKRVLLALDRNIWHDWPYEREARGKCGVALLQGMLQIRDIAGVRQFIQSTAHDEMFYYLPPLAKFGLMDAALETYGRLSESGQRDLILAAAREGQSSWVSGHLSDVPPDDDRDSILKALAIGQAHLGNFDRAGEWISQIRDPLSRLNASQVLAGYQLKAGNTSQALRTMRSAVTTPVQNFDSWAVYSALTSLDADSTDEPASVNQVRRKLAAQISDPYWQALALQQTVASETDPQILAMTERAVREPLIRAAVELQLVHALVSRQRISEAAATSAKMSDRDYQAMAASDVAYAAVDLGRWSDVATLISTLPEGAAKAYLYTDVAWDHATGRRGAPAVRGLAIRAASHISDNYWRACAYVEIGRLAEIAPDQVAIGETRGLVESTTAQLSADEQAMLTYHQQGLRSEVANQPDASTRERVRKWSDLNEYALNHPLFLDLPNYVQKLSGEPTAGVILDGLTDAVRDYSRELRNLRIFDPDKAN